jgi:hypothetical protein
MERLREELSVTRRELSATREALAATQQTLADLARRVDSLEPSAPAAVPDAAVTARLAPVNADNPAISFVVNAAVSADRRSSWESIGYPNGVDFALLDAELFLSAPVDPYLRGYASINASSEEGIRVEEAALVTAALPWNLALRGGRFFADFGRLPHWHNEALPFVDRPPSIDRLIGGESVSEGLEVSWLAPLEQFVVLKGGLYNAVGAENLEELNEDGFFGRRSFDELNVLGRLQTYLDLTDALNVELGGSWLGVPRGNERSLWGVDLTLRHQPGTAGFYQGLAWGSEWLWNRQRFSERDDTTGDLVARTRHTRQGGYSYIEAFLARQYSAGMRFDYSEAPEDDAELGLARDLARTYSLFASWKPSEFHRLRFQFDQTWGDQPNNQRFTLQWTAFLGSHIHGFAQR